MPAAARTEALGVGKPRGKVPPRPDKTRRAPVPSKLKAAHGAGISRPLAIIALCLLLVLGVVVVLATGGRGERVAQVARAAMDTHLASLGFTIPGGAKYNLQVNHFGWAATVDDLAASPWDLSEQSKPFTAGRSAARALVSQ